MKPQKSLFRELQMEMGASIAGIKACSVKYPSSFFLLLVGCVLLLLNIACTSQEYHYPYYVQSHPPPGEAQWLKLDIIGTNPKKMVLVRNEFIRLGWDARRIKMELKEKKPGEPESNLVKAIISGGDMDIPVMEIGLDAVARGAIQGIVASYRPISASPNCHYEVSINHWERPLPNGEIIAELKKTGSWEYKYGSKKEGSIVFTNCVESLTRLDPSGLPWTGDWTLLAVNSNDEQRTTKDEILRSWFKKQPFSITIEPLQVIRTEE